MAYVNLVNQTVANKAEAFARIRDFICKRNGTYDYSTTGIGWALHDSAYAVDENNPQAGDWFVVKSTGEGTKDYLYYRFLWDTTDFEINGMLHWNATTHTSSVNYQTLANNFKFLNAATSVPLYVYGDLDSVVIVAKHSDYAYMTSFGKMVRPFSSTDDTIATCSSSLSSGSDVSIALDSAPATWKVGGHIYIWSSDATTTNVEKAEIKTIVSNTITADLTKSYSANSRVSQHNGYHAQGTINASSSRYVLIDGFGTSGAINYSHTPLISYNNTLLTYGDPDPFDSEYSIVDSIMGHSTHGFTGVIKNLKQVSYTGLVDGDVLTLPDGTEYRFFKVYPGLGIVSKEV